jgi:class 3 adenylate cyclase
MKTLEEIKKEIAEIFRTKWERRASDSVPEPEDVTLGNDAVEIEGVVLYADLADSTGLVLGHKDWFVAEVYKAYLRSACDIIANNGGIITAFDGDRVMAVFIGTNKNTAAAKTALQINYCVRQVLNPAIKARYTTTTYQIEQAVGIDRSNLFVAKTGIRGSNDLVWVGRSANYAAKLCSLREGNFSSFMTEDVFENLHESAKFSGTNRQAMWEKVMWSDRGIAVYRSSWWWQPS